MRGVPNILMHPQPADPTCDIFGKSEGGTLKRRRTEPNSSYILMTVTPMNTSLQ